MTTTNQLDALTELAIAADYLREHTSFEAAAQALYQIAFNTLLPFCDPHPFRAGIGEPFVQGGWLYATDAKICVRVPCGAPDSVGKFPNAGSLFDMWSVKPTPKQVRHRDGGAAYEGAVAWQPWPTKPVQVVFVATDESMQSEIPCPVCRGAGQLWADGDAYACVYCDRTGYLERFDNVSMGNPFYASSPLIAGKYWSLISRLPDVWYREPKSHESPIHFRFRGGEGLLMPIDRSKQ